jgi:hypothetical protein
MQQQIILTRLDLHFLKPQMFFLHRVFSLEKVKVCSGKQIVPPAGQTKFDLGTSGFVFGGFGRKAKNSFGITVTQQANFNYNTYYKGENDYSSYGEPLADEFAASGLTIDQALLYTSSISIPTRMALYTYLVDTVNVNGAMQVIARSENPSSRNQENKVESTGGITEINLGWGSELSKKWMAGISLGIDIINQERKNLFS